MNIACPSRRTLYNISGVDIENNFSKNVSLYTPPYWGVLRGGEIKAKANREYNEMSLAHHLFSGEFAF